MIREITLGQYYQADSVIHRLDPRVKLFATFIYIISLFCFKGIAALLVATVFLIAGRYRKYRRYRRKPTQKG